jgi:hypothetical protein
LEGGRELHILGDSGKPQDIVRIVGGSAETGNQYLRKQFYSEFLQECRRWKNYETTTSSVRIVSSVAEIGIV